MKLLELDKPEVDGALYKTRPRSPIMSCATGTWLSATDTKSLMASIASTILNEPLMFAKVLSGCKARASQFEDPKCLILPLGPTQNGETLQQLLADKNGLNLDVVLRTPPPVSRESTACSVGNHGPSGKCKLAIVGMAGRFPDAASHEELWKLLEKGLDVHREVPPDRFNFRTHTDPTEKKKNTSITPYGCWIKEPGLFDHRFFSMSPREARNTDPMQRMALTTAYEALEMSGYVPNRTPSTRPDRIGTFYGQTSDDWREINAAQDIDTYFITGGVRAFGPGRINYHFKFTGPSLNIDTACSSSAAAMQVACTALWARDCDTAVVGGLSCMTNPDIFAGLSKGQFLTKKGPCATFDHDADGYCRGDGCATVIVKRLEDALADQDRVLGVILGTATNHSSHAVSITHPHAETQSILSTTILDEAGVDPHDIDYVEMHGTGTQAGDGTEMESVTNVFAPAHRPRPKERPLFLGAVKANVGHGEAASGVTALIKVLMMLEKNTIPPHVGIKPGSVMNLAFPKDLEARGVNIVFGNPAPFKRNDGKPRLVFVNNFSAAGGNTGLLLEEAPAGVEAKMDPRTHHIVTLTGKAKASLTRNATRLIDWIKSHPGTPVSHIAYSTTARKIQHHWRMSVTGTDLGAIQAGLTKRLEHEATLAPAKPVAPKVVFVFTGQGSQYTAMGKEFYQHHSVFRKSIDGFVDLAITHGFPSFLPLIDGSEPDVSKLSPLVLQLGLTCFQMALARLWASWGIKPAAVVGHSLGEYAALEVAGVLSASDAIYLVGSRAQLLLERCTIGSHGMIAVQGSVDGVLEALGARAAGLNVACINGHSETVLSGEAGLSLEMAASLTSCGFKCSHLKVPFAFHSPQVDVILDDFEKLAQGVSYNTPRVTVISPVIGKVIQGQSINANYLRRHARDPVNFLGGLVDAQHSDVMDDETVWLEIGPHPILTNVIKTTFGGSTVAVPTMRRGEPCYKTLTNCLSDLHSAGLNINWNEYHRDFADAVRLLDLPSYSFDESNHWIQYKGDWCLKKFEISQLGPEISNLPTTTTVQKVVKEQVEDGVATLEIESDLFQPELRNAVSGHMVNGAPLCPSSLYGDMAMTVCDYAYKLLRPETNKIGCNVAEMEVPKTLIFDDQAESQILRLTVKANAELGFADLVFHTGEDAKRVEHARCKVYYGSLDDWQTEFDRAAYLIKSRVDLLKEAEQRGAASKIGRGLAYKLFSALVDYAPRYRGMEEVILNSADCEATAKIRFQTTAQDGTFYFSPYHIDSVCHISGFIINGTDAVDSRETVFISHGWGSMRFTEIPDANKEYRSYIRMQPTKGNKVMVGDAYVFDGDRIIGMTGNIKFQAIPRKVLNVMLPPRGALAAAYAPTKPAPAASSTKTTPATKAPRATKAAAPKKKKKETVTNDNIGKVNEGLRSVVDTVMALLAKEVGCSQAELADNIALADIGVDSLMSLTVAGKIREELQLSIHSNAFIDYNTVGKFKDYIKRFEKADRQESEESQASVGSSDSDSGDSDSESNVTTPPDESETHSVKSGAPAESGKELQEFIHKAIAKEVGVDVEEVRGVAKLGDLGVDSIMGLNICSVLRERMGGDVSNDLFLTHQTLAEVERALGVHNAPEKPANRKQQSKGQPKSSSATAARVHPRIGLDEPAPPKPPRPTNIVDEYPHRKAPSVLLSGVKDGPRHLFMVPDGGGSATSYTSLADIGGGWSVWGLYSPFMKTPSEYTCGVYGMATKFIEEMKKRQSHGPYSVAGWSAGGVIAYEIVYQLTQMGEEVENLILIDAPCPVTIEPLPQGLHAWFASIGVLGDGDPSKVPQWLLPHFTASITALSTYNVKRIPDKKCPKVMAIWCEDGVCHLPTDPRPEPYPKGHARFLLDDRTDFGPNRWDEYLDADKMQFRHMPGNHFTMVQGELVCYSRPGVFEDGKDANSRGTGQAASGFHPGVRDGVVAVPTAAAEPADWKLPRLVHVLILYLNLAYRHIWQFSWTWLEIVWCWLWAW
jgi:iterative type I PKS product template protein